MKYRTRNHGENVYNDVDHGAGRLGREWSESRFQPRYEAWSSFRRAVMGLLLILKLPLRIESLRTELVGVTESCFSSNLLV